MYCTKAEMMEPNTARIGTPEREIPIAIVGMAYEFPQEAMSDAAFWNILHSGRSTSTEFPQDRLNIDAYHHPDGDRPSTIPVRGGHFISEKLASFDAPFFSISPAEAACMDPQHRRMLETAYHAIEDAGISISQCVGSDTSVYTGCFTNDYLSILQQDYESEQRHAAMGIAPSMLANRLSWFFNFKGTSLNLDSACSSSLLALHLACQELKSGGSSMALVCGANLVYHPNFMKMMSDFNFLSPDSQCWSFDQRANGYARGEGFAVLVVKTLDRALEDGDTIRAIIRNTGTNQDGRTPGITQPNKEAQVELIKATYLRGKVDMDPTRYFEAHGTGTPVGDPAEAYAIGTAFQNIRNSNDPLYVGAVKANIGHLEGASGLAGIVKTVLVLEKGIIPPIANLHALNKSIESDTLPLCFPKTATMWPTPGLRRACVNSFGFGGTNATAILDDAFHYMQQHAMSGYHRTQILQTQTNEPNPLLNETPSSNSSQDSNPGLLVWSAFDKKTLEKMSSLYGEYIYQNPQHLKALTFTLSARKSMFNWKSFAVASVHSVSQISLPEKVITNPKCAFVFTGQGAQYAKMGQGLDRYSVYVGSLSKSQQILATLGCDWNVSELLMYGHVDIDINQPAISQPLTTIFQIALYDLVVSCGFSPAVVVGHSSGEIAAAYAAGALTRSSAIKVAYYRGMLSSRLSKEHQGRLAMMAVGLSKSKVEEYLSRLLIEVGKLHVYIGCVNSPQSITLTGDAHQLDVLKTWLENDSVFVRKLRVPVAYHSRYMESIVDEYTRLMGLIDGERCSLRIPMISSVTGDIVSPSELQTAHYWICNLTSTVQFEKAFSKLIGETTQKHMLNGSTQRDVHCSHVLEIGPHSTLKGPIRQIIHGSEAPSNPIYIAPLLRGEDTSFTFLKAMGVLYCAGYPIKLLTVNTMETYRAATPPDIPKYPFNHTHTYWRESRFSRNMRFPTKARHDLLGTRSLDWNQHIAQWRNVIRISEVPWLNDHRISGDVIFPAAAMIVMAVEALAQLSGHKDAISLGQVHLKDIEFLHPISFHLEKDFVETQLILSGGRNQGSRDSWTNFRLFAIEDDQYVESCHGLIRQSTEVDAQVFGLYAPSFMQGKTCYGWIDEICSVTKGETEQNLYNLSTGSKVQYGPAFQNLEGMRASSTGEGTTRLNTGSWRCKDTHWPGPNYAVHPATLDGLAQIVVPILHRKIGSLPTMVPSKVSNMWLNLDRDSLRDGFIHVAAKCGHHDQRGATTNIVASTMDLQCPLVLMDGLRTTFISGDDESTTRYTKRTLCTSLIWRPDIRSMSTHEIMQYCTISRPKQPPTTVESYRSIIKAIMCFVEDAVRFVDQNPKLQVPRHLQSYIKWLRYQRQRLLRNEAPVELDSVTQLLSDPDAREQFICDVMNSGIEGHFFMYLGSHLIEILRGEADPLQLMFGDGLADRYYEAMLANEHHAHPATAWIDLASFENSSMTILEVGAGTGGQTLRLLQTLSRDGLKRLQRYDYTDISPGFFGQAREKFKDYIDHMSFRVCDISKDPVSQSFEEGAYDLVIASHVLHATNSLEQSLRNIRRLLKVQGKLLLFETTVPDAVPIGFGFGLLQGWWDPLDNEERSTLSPCLSTDAWADRLKRAGFTGVDVEIPGQEEIECRYSSIIISTALEEDITAARHESSFTIAVILDPKIEAQERLAVALRDVKRHPNIFISIHTLEEVAVQSFTTSSILVSLLEVDNVFLGGISEAQYKALQSVLTQHKTVLWVTRDINGWSEPQHHLVDGLGRTLMSEDSIRKFTTLCLQKDGETPESVVGLLFKLIDKVFNLPVERLENNYMVRDGTLHINRIVEQPEIDTKVSQAILPFQRSDFKIGSTGTLKLHVQKPGEVSSIEWREEVTHVEDIQLGEDEVIVDVKAIGLSERDRMVVSGILDNEMVLENTECSGVILQAGHGSFLTPGQRVCVLHNSINYTRIRVPAAAAVVIPDEMTFSTAASLPTSLWHAYHALIDLARLEKGETVLIHDADDCISQLAIQIAKRLGATILTTASSNSERADPSDYCKDPAIMMLPPRVDLLPHAIYRETHGKGVDVIVGAFAPSSIPDLTGCLKPCGRLINLHPNHGDTLGISGLTLKGLSISSVDLLGVLRASPRKVYKVFQKAFMLALEWNVEPPKELHVFDAPDYKDAFTHLLETEVIGKRIIELREDSTVPASITTKAKCRFRHDATYIIGGGLGGLGRSFARWMVQRGARNLVLLSRSGPKSGTAKTLVKELQERGVNVLTPAVDISNLEDLVGALGYVTKSMPPVRGCIQATVALRDNLFENMSYEDWLISTQSKVQGSWNLHVALPSGLDFFVLLSSLNGIFGGRAQANYAAGNTFKDALAHYRIDQGEKAVSIDLGLMVAEGVVAENEFLLESMRRIGHLMEIQQDELIALLDIYCDTDLPLLSHDDVQILVGIELPSMILQKGIDLHHSIRRPVFRHLFCMAPDPTGASDADSKGTLISKETALKEANTSDEAIALVVEWFSGKIAHVLGLKEDDIDKTKPINAYGIDSLVAIDLKNWMQREIGSEMEIFVLLANVSLEDMCKEAVSKSSFLSKEGAKGDPLKVGSQQE